MIFSCRIRFKFFAAKTLAQRSSLHSSAITRIGRLLFRPFICLLVSIILAAPFSSLGALSQGPPADSSRQQVAGQSLALAKRLDAYQRNNASEKNGMVTKLAELAQSRQELPADHTFAIILQASATVPTSLD